MQAVENKTEKACKSRMFIAPGGKIKHKNKYEIGVYNKRENVYNK